MRLRKKGWSIESRGVARHFLDGTLPQLDHPSAHGHGYRSCRELLQEGFRAQEVFRNSYPNGRMIAEMSVGDARFRMADEEQEAHNLNPQTLKSDREHKPARR